jgi:hypothetical protein
MSEHSAAIRELVTKDLIGYGLTPAQAEELIAEADRRGRSLTKPSEGKR